MLIALFGLVSYNDPSLLVEYVFSSHSDPWMVAVYGICREICHSLILGVQIECNSWFLLGGGVVSQTFGNFHTQKKRGNDPI